MDNRLVLLSGGIDSTVLLYDLMEQGVTPYVLTFRNGFNKTEVECANKLADKKQVLQFTIDTVDFDSSKEVFYRNNIYLDYAMHLAKNLKCKSIYFATHYPDHHFLGEYYEDCSPEFCLRKNEEFKQYGVALETPFLRLPLWRIIEKGRRLGVDFSELQWCNADQAKNCGFCSKCSYINEYLEDYSNPMLNIREVRLYINNLCDKSCPFCSYHKMGDFPDYMSEEVLQAVSNYLFEWHIERVMISGREPLFNINFFNKVIPYIPSFTKLLINTNGTNIHQLGNLTRYNKIYLSINRHNLPDIPKHLCKQVTPYVVVESLEEFEELKPSLARYEQKPYLRKDVYSKDNGKFPPSSDYDLPDVHGECISGLKNITVLTDGSVIGCAKRTYKSDSLKAQIMGNIKDSQSFMELLKERSSLQAPVCSVMEKELRMYGP